jgi:hypothetical protein
VGEASRAAAPAAVAVVPVAALLMEPDRGLSFAAMPACVGSESLAAALTLPDPKWDRGPGLWLLWGLSDTSNVGGPCSLITFIWYTTTRHARATRLPRHQRERVSGGSARV